VLGQLSVLHFVQTEYQQARELAEEALSLAQQIDDPLHVMLGHWYLGIILFNLGKYTTTRAHLKHVFDFYNPEQHHRSLVFLRGSDSGTSALAYDACCLWCLGYPDQALIKSQETIDLARELDHPFSLADALCYAGCLFNVMRRDAPALKIYAEQLLQLSNEIGLAGWIGTATCFHGEAIAMLGQVSEGIAQIHAGMAANEPIFVRLNLVEALRAMAEAQVKAGRPQEGLTILVEALDLAEQTGESHWEAELHRLRADLLLMLNDEEGAEANFKKAIEVARQQKARSWELRAATNLARLWQKQGKKDGARQLLGEIYSWFTEGFDTPDLIEARTLLDKLS
jgi:predicted ATPase